MANIVKILRSVIGYTPSNTRPTIASASSMELPDDANSIIVSGNATVTALSANSPIRSGRVVRLVGAASAAVIFTNTNDTVTKGQMDLGGANITLGATDVLQLEQQETGAWLRVSLTDN